MYVYPFLSTGSGSSIRKRGVAEWSACLVNRTLLDYFLFLLLFYIICYFKNKIRAPTKTDVSIKNP